MDEISKIINDMEQIYPLYIDKPEEGYNEKLCREIQNGNKDAEIELLVRNRLLARDITLKYYYGNNIEDAYMAVLYSFINSAKKCDEEKGKFSTYAYFWGRAVIEKEILAKEDNIRIPSHLQGKILELRKIINKDNDDNLNISNKELADKLGITEYTLTMLLQYIKQIESLDKEIHTSDNDNNINKYNFIESDYNLEENITEKIFVSEILNEAKDILTDNEYKVIMIRYGIENEYPMTLKETSKYLKNKYNINLTVERVRQLELKAIYKLRKSRPLIKEIKESYPELIDRRRKRILW